MLLCSMCHTKQLLVATMPFLKEPKKKEVSKPGGRLEFVYSWRAIWLNRRWGYMQQQQKKITCITTQYTKHTQKHKKTHTHKKKTHDVYVYASLSARRPRIANSAFLSRKSASSLTRRAFLSSSSCSAFLIISLS